MQGGKKENDGREGKEERRKEAKEKLKQNEQEKDVKYIMLNAEGSVIRYKKLKKKLLNEI